MPTWMTSAQIAERYIVGEQRLLAYRERGNLPARILENGELVFDESVVAQFFRPRAAALATAGVLKGPHLGVLGVVQLGVRPSPSALAPVLGLAETRRRATRLGAPRRSVCPTLTGTDSVCPALTGTDHGR